MVPVKCILSPPHPVARAAVRSKAVVLLLLINCLLLLPLFVGGGGLCILFLFCYSVLCVRLCNHLDKEERAACLALMSSWCHVTVSVVALPHGAVGWSGVCDCGISRSYSLVF